jgi:hypothetical protein
MATAPMAAVPKLNLTKLGITPNPNAGKATFNPYVTSGEWGLRVEAPQPKLPSSKVALPSPVSAEQLAQSLKPAAPASSLSVVTKTVKAKPPKQLDQPAQQGHSAHARTSQPHPQPAPRTTVPKAQLKPKMPTYTLDSSARCPPATMPVQSKTHVNQSCLQDGNILGTKPTTNLKATSTLVSRLSAETVCRSHSSMAD